ncbi:MAG TPA: protein kinase [Kofleriaceae bacterium]
MFASRYRVEERVGDGAMGTVYRARHIKVGRAFAVKVLHPRLLSDHKVQKRFEREAELAGSLHHINVIGVVDVGETPEGVRYLVMEYADGPTLGDIIGEQAPLPAGRVIALAQQLCDGLQHAHERGLIHRDFKPENVIVERDRHGSETPRIVDFGVAILRDDAASPERERLTTAGLVLGTPHYMAPEHATGQAIDHRIDLFALGVILYEMVSGLLPFDGDGVDVARANLVQDTPPMSVRAPGVQVDPLLEALVRKLMTKSRDLRPPDARAVRRLLDLIERDRPAAAAELGVGGDVGGALPRYRVPRASTAPAQHPMPTSSDGVPIDRPPGQPPAIEVITQPTRMPTGMSADPLTPVHPVPPAPSRPFPAPGMRDERAVTTDSVVPARKHRIGWIAAAGAAVLVALLLFAMTRSKAAQVPDAPPSPPVAVTGHDRLTAKEPPAASPPAASLPPPAASLPPPAASLPPPPPVTAAPVEPVPPPAPVVVAPPPPVTHPTRPTRPIAHPAPVHVAPAPTPAEPPEPLPAPVAAPSGPATSAQVAALYSQVGRDLKALDVARGSAATADLWPLYLRVRINDVIADPVKRAEAMALLSRLQMQVAARK